MFLKKLGRIFTKPKLAILRKGCVFPEPTSYMANKGDICRFQTGHVEHADEGLS